MVSVIICSNQTARFAAAKAAYERTFGADQFELIGIHDAKSLAEGYNRAVAHARGDVLLFSHDDVEVLGDNLPRRIERCMLDFDIVGVAGTTRLVGPAWYLAGHGYVFGQVAHPTAPGAGAAVGTSAPLLVTVYNAPRPMISGIHCLDGVMFFARREVLNRVKFDEVTFDGWHHYDIDFTFAAHCAGHKLAVACDISVLHQSVGNFTGQWHEYAGRFSRKWNCNRQDLQRPKSFVNVPVWNKAQCLEVMNPPYWKET